MPVSSCVSTGPTSATWRASPRTTSSTTRRRGKFVANVWNADPEWKIEVYENGARTGEMLPFDSSVTRRDAWASGYHCGVLGRNPDNYDRKSTSHLYYYTLKNPAAEVEVRATDRFGNVYTQSHITTASPGRLSKLRIRH